MNNENMSNSIYELQEKLFRIENINFGDFLEFTNVRDLVEVSLRRRQPDKAALLMKYVDKYAKKVYKNCQTDPLYLYNSTSFRNLRCKPKPWLTKTDLQLLSQFNICRKLQIDGSKNNILKEKNNFLDMYLILFRNCNSTANANTNLRLEYINSKLRKYGICGITKNLKKKLFTGQENKLNTTDEVTSHLIKENLNKSKNIILENSIKRKPGPKSKIFRNELKQESAAKSENIIDLNRNKKTINTICELKKKPGPKSKTIFDLNINKQNEGSEQTKIPDSKSQTLVPLNSNGKNTKFLTEGKKTPGPKSKTMIDVNSNFEQLENKLQEQVKFETNRKNGNDASKLKSEVKSVAVLASDENSNENVNGFEKKTEVQVTSIIRKKPFSINLYELCKSKYTSDLLKNNKGLEKIPVEQQKETNKINNNNMQKNNPDIELHFIKRKPGPKSKTFERNLNIKNDYSQNELQKESAPKGETMVDLNQNFKTSNNLCEVQKNCDHKSKTNLNLKTKNQNKEILNEQDKASDHEAETVVSLNSYEKNVNYVIERKEKCVPKFKTMVHDSKIKQSKNELKEQCKLKPNFIPIIETNNKDDNTSNKLKTELKSKVVPISDKNSNQNDNKLEKNFEIYQHSKSKCTSASINNVEDLEKIPAEKQEGNNQINNNTMQKKNSDISSPVISIENKHSILYKEESKFLKENEICTTEKIDLNFLFKHFGSTRINNTYYKLFEKYAHFNLSEEIKQKIIIKYENELLLKNKIKKNKKEENLNSSVKEEIFRMSLDDFKNKTNIRYLIYEMRKPVVGAELAFYDLDKRVEAMYITFIKKSIWLKHLKILDPNIANIASDCKQTALKRNSNELSNDKNSKDVKTNNFADTSIIGLIPSYSKKYKVDINDVSDSTKSNDNKMSNNDSKETNIQPSKQTNKDNTNFESASLDVIQNLSPNLTPTKQNSKKFSTLKTQNFKNIENKTNNNDFPEQLDTINNVLTEGSRKSINNLFDELYLATHEGNNNEENQNKSHISIKKEHDSQCLTYSDLLLILSSPTRKRTIIEDEESEDVNKILKNKSKEITTPKELQFLNHCTQNELKNTLTSNCENNNKDLLILEHVNKKPCELNNTNFEIISLHSKQNLPANLTPTKNNTTINKQNKTNDDTNLRQQIETAASELSEGSRNSILGLFNELYSSSHEEHDIEKNENKFNISIKKEHDSQYSNYSDEVLILSPQKNNTIIIEDEESEDVNKILQRMMFSNSEDTQNKSKETSISKELQLLDHCTQNEANILNSNAKINKTDVNKKLNEITLKSNTCMNFEPNELDMNFEKFSNKSAPLYSNDELFKESVTNKINNALPTFSNAFPLKRYFNTIDSTVSPILNLPKRIRDRKGLAKKIMQNALSNETDDLFLENPNILSTTHISSQRHISSQDSEKEQYNRNLSNPIFIHSVEYNQTLNKPNEKICIKEKNPEKTNSNNVEVAPILEGLDFSLKDNKIIEGESPFSSIKKTVQSILDSEILKDQVKRLDVSWESKPKQFKNKSIKISNEGLIKKQQQIGENQSLVKFGGRSFKLTDHLQQILSKRRQSSEKKSKNEIKMKKKKTLEKKLKANKIVSKVNSNESFAVQERHKFQPLHLIVNRAKKSPKVLKGQNFLKVQQHPDILKEITKKNQPNCETILSCQPKGSKKM